MTTIDLATAATAPFDPTPEHARFAPLAGTWAGTSSTWFDPPNPPEESPVDARIDVILGGRFLRIEYASTVMGKPHTGMMLLAFEKDANQHQLVWIDSFHTANKSFVSTGAPADDGVVKVLTHYEAGDQRWGWRTEIRGAADKLVIDAFNIHPDGQVDPATKLELTRR